MSLMSGFFSSRPEMRDPASLCEVCFRMWFGPLSVLPANQARLIKIYFPKEAPEVLGKRLFCVHQPSATDLHESSQSGCHCCMLIWHHAFEDREDILTKLSAKHPIILYTEKASSAEYDMLWMPGNGTRMEISRGGKHYGNLRFLRLSYTMTDLFKSNASLYSSHLANLRLAKLWLARCWVNHPQCLQPRVPLMPHRLVDVDPQDGSKDPCLVVPHERSRYLALSHCWGNGTVLKTTTKNLHQRQEGIPFSSLSKTFQEAVQITRAFGIRYIWIDSLCILQDSTADWEYEAAGMCRTYSNALFTITAGGASAGEEGIFPTTHHRLQTPCSLPSLDNLLSTTSPQYKIHVVHPADDKPGGQTNPRGPLYDRAWVLQEEVISHATLAFTKDGMYWNCLGYKANYSDPEPSSQFYEPNLVRDLIGSYSQLREVNTLEGEAVSLGKVSMMPQTGPSYTIRLSSEHIGALYKNWSDIVTTYYKRSITYPSDRLPALAGIAQGLQNTLQGREKPGGKWRPFPGYLAGIWSTDFKRGLLWSPHNYEPWLREHFNDDQKFVAEMTTWRIKPPQAFVGPSLSWCSMYESPVCWNGVYSKTWEGPNEFHYLEMRKWSYSSEYKFFGPFWEARVEVEGFLEAVDVRDGEFLHGVPRPGADRRMIGRLIKDEPGEIRGDVFLMPVLQEPEETMESWNVYCLALVPTGLNKGEYRRVGLGFVAFPGWFVKTKSQIFTIV